MRNYKEVPLTWFIALIGIAFLIIMTVVAKTDLYIPWWTVLVAMGTGAVVVVVCFQVAHFFIIKLTHS